MGSIKTSIIRVVFFMMSIQLVLTGAVMPLITTNASGSFIVNITSHSTPEPSSKKQDASNQDFSDEDDNTAQTESFDYAKIIDQDSTVHFDFNITKLELVKFIYFNSKDKVLFHPEFSTPPPKYILA